MNYQDVVTGSFITRPNRFIAEVLVDGKIEIAHVKNTGRCKELLVPDAKVILQKSGNPSRATKYDLIAVWKDDRRPRGERLINMDSHAPNKVFAEYLQSGRYIDGITIVKPETKYGGSRFDFYVEAADRKIFIEVKGVTLEENGVVLFPDAPTERGVKHLNELVKCLEDGYESHVVFVVQMNGVKYFMPNVRTHPAFSTALENAKAAGVIVAAFDCDVTENSLSIGKPVEVRL